MKILIVKTSALGDIIHAFPVVSFLKKEFPDAQIDWVIEKSHVTLVKAHPLVNHVIEMDTKGWRKGLFKKDTWKKIWDFKRALKTEKYDIVVDLQGNTKSAIPTFLARSAHKIGFGSKTIHEWPNLLVTHHRYNPPLHINVRDENLYLVQHYFERFTPVENETVVLKLNEEEKQQFRLLQSQFATLKGSKTLICPGSAWKNKQLSTEALNDLLASMKEHAFVFCWGTQEEKSLVEKLHQQYPHSILLDKLSLPLLQNVMGCVDLVIAMDSLPLHLAGTSGTATLSFFGASSAEKYKPLGSQHKAIQGPCPYGVTFERRCPKLRTCPTGACIRKLDLSSFKK